MERKAAGGVFRSREEKGSFLLFGSFQIFSEPETPLSQKEDNLYEKPAQGFREAEQLGKPNGRPALG